MSNVLLPTFGDPGKELFPNFGQIYSCWLCPKPFYKRLRSCSFWSVKIGLSFRLWSFSDFQKNQKCNRFYGLTFWKCIKDLNMNLVFAFSMNYSNIIWRWHISSSFLKSEKNSTHFYSNDQKSFRFPTLTGC